jgi:HNH endonuclease
MLRPLSWVLANNLQCYERDQKICVLTKAGEPIEVAHIYPFSMRYEDNTTRGISFWDTLRMFWSKERVDAWYNAIFPTGTEVCQNLICLAPHAHAYWERAYFVLKPIRISDDKKRLDVQFFWLPKRSYSPEVDILHVPQLPAYMDQGPNLVMLFNCKTRIPICSGDEIFLETDDPVSRPLPDFRLLEMQWVLHRLTAVSGAAEPQDDFQGDDSDDDIEEALQNGWDMYTEDDWDMDIEERFPTQLSGIHTFGRTISLRGGARSPEMQDRERQDRERQDRERQDREREDREG